MAKYNPKHSIRIPEFDTKDGIKLLSNLRKHDEKRAIRYMILAAILVMIMITIMVLLGVQL